MLNQGYLDVEKLIFSGSYLWIGLIGDMLLSICFYVFWYTVLGTQGELFYKQILMIIVFDHACINLDKSF